MNRSRIASITSHAWRNENPGEGGVVFTALLEDGETISLGNNGYELVRVEGGWRSVATEATVACVGDLVEYKVRGERKLLVRVIRED